MQQKLPLPEDATDQEILIRCNNFRDALRLAKEKSGKSEQLIAFELDECGHKIDQSTLSLSLSQICAHISPPQEGKPATSQAALLSAYADQLLTLIEKNERLEARLSALEASSGRQYHNTDELTPERAAYIRELARQRARGNKGALLLHNAIEKRRGMQAQQ